MRAINWILVLTLGMLTGAGTVMATEEAVYKVLKKDHEFEQRAYGPVMIAETIVDGGLEEAGNKAFRRLFRYIAGDNRSLNNIPMTAPVSQEQKGEKIAMTAPVSQERVLEKWAVSFMMPASYTKETLPIPDDPSVTLRQVPARQVAVIRYSGFWSEEKYLFNKQKLEAWIEKNNLTVVGKPVWARYNAPVKPWFLRRNEILIPVAEAIKAD